MLPRSAIVVLATVLLVGCSNEEFGIAQVSGTVTLDGKPIAQVAVMFQPLAQGNNINPGPGSFGVTDENGKYSLELVGLRKKGAAVGKHQVRFDPYSTEQQDPSSDAPFVPTKPLPKIPSRYNSITPQFEFEVTQQGSTSADFALTTGEEKKAP